LRALVGVDRFGSLVFQRRSRLDAMRALAGEAGWPPLCGRRVHAAILFNPAAQPANAGHHRLPSNA
jgi:hypothetical protein